MSSQTIEATYLIETPLDPHNVAEIMAGEQSCGTFVRVAGETDALRARAAASILSVEELEPAAHATLSSAFLERKGLTTPPRRARVRLAFPVANVGSNLPTLSATLAGNLFDLGEVTGMRLEDIDMPHSFRSRFDAPKQGIAGTREMAGAAERPLFGTIIKPNVGLSAEETADIVQTLCEAGVDFIKDDEITADPDHAPLAERIPAVMKRIRAYRERTGRNVIMAFNITDETSAMCRHADLVEREGGDCIMASMNWCGLSGMQTLRRHSDLALHAHQNGSGAFARNASHGIGGLAYQVLYRLAGIDHMHVHGTGSKFAVADEEVDLAARRCQMPVAKDGPVSTDSILPVFSSRQWAGTVKRSLQSAGGSDFMLLAGGGILAHPQGPKAGVDSMLDAFAAITQGKDPREQAEPGSALHAAFEFFGE